jgi:hypothetical protein
MDAVSSFDHAAPGILCVLCGSLATRYSQHNLPPITTNHVGRAALGCPVERNSTIFVRDSILNPPRSVPQPSVPPTQRLRCPRPSFDD